MACARDKPNRSATEKQHAVTIAKQLTLRIFDGWSFLKLRILRLQIRINTPKCLFSGACDIGPQANRPEAASCEDIRWPIRPTINRTARDEIQIIWPGACYLDCSDCCQCTTDHRDGQHSLRAISRNDPRAVA